MAYKWSEKEIGMLQLGNGGEKKTLIAPSEQIPDELLTPQLMERFGDKIIEYEIVREVKKPKPKKGDK